MPPIPASPPKRMTRARAKAVEEKKQSTATSATKSTTARAAATKKPTAATAAAAKRKAKAQEETKDELSPEDPTEEPSEKVTTTTTKTASSAPKPKGRPRKNTVSKDPVPNTATATAPTTRTKAAAAPKKKVTFKENDDKENTKEVPAKKGAAKAVNGKGMAAKPVRKPATSTSNKAASKESTQPRVPSPLSPKKDTQVAKGNATSQDESDDELGQDSGPPVSPKKTGDGLLSNVPAKRPPPSPFKDTMRDSPRKMAIAIPSDQDRQQEPQSPQRTLSQSPKKFNMASVGKPGPLQLDGPAETFGKSLFKSPARRPPSPIKFAPGTPGDRSANKGPDLTASVLKSRSPQRFNFSPAKNLTAAFQAVSPGKVPSSSSSEAVDEEAVFVDVLQDAPSPFTPGPVRAASKGVLPSAEVGEQSRLPESDCEEPDEVNVVQDEDEEAVDNLKGEPNSNNNGLDEAFDEAIKAGPAFEPRDENNLDTMDEDSEDELQSESSLYKAASSTKSRLSAHFRPALNSTVATPSHRIAQQQIPLTALAEKFGQWQGATPDQNVIQQRMLEKSMFSPLGKASQQLPFEDDEDISMTDSMTEIADSVTEVATEPDGDAQDVSLATSERRRVSEQPGAVDALEELRSEFDHEFEICEDDEMIDADAASEPDVFRQSQMSEASQEYGDENALPIEHAARTPRPTEPTMPMATVTPVNTFNSRREMAYTVSKVPLKPSADFETTPLHVAKKRRQSLSSSLTPRAQLDLQALRQVHPSASTALSEESDSASAITTATSRMGQTLAPSQMTPRRVTTGSMSSTGLTPGRADQRLLRGVVAYVDVHTAEGAEASSIFIELLTQMGARCVKQWTWKSRASVGPDSPSADSEEDEGSGKLGVTHVVFKDGGKRTMEKVREAKGRVHCVGVGWVLDCERTNQRLDETDYAVDKSLIPRGGHRRRKSMEPKAISNLNGSLSLASSPRKLSPPQMSPTKEFLNFATPSRGETTTLPLNDRRVSFAPHVAESPESPATPDRNDQGPQQYDTPPMPGYAESNFGSPTTPYFLHPTQLVQQTCPPKQNQELFFPVSGRIDDADERIRRRLVLARRKSLQFAPKIGSPLARDE